MKQCKKNLTSSIVSYQRLIQFILNGNNVLLLLPWQKSNSNLTTSPPPPPPTPLFYHNHRQHPILSLRLISKPAIHWLWRRSGYTGSVSFSRWARRRFKMNRNFEKVCCWRRRESGGDTMLMLYICTLLLIDWMLPKYTYVYLLKWNGWNIMELSMLINWNNRFLNENKFNR